MFFSQHSEAFIAYITEIFPHHLIFLIINNSDFSYSDSSLLVVLVKVTLLLLSCLAHQNIVQKMVFSPSREKVILNFEKQVRMRLSGGSRKKMDQRILFGLSAQAKSCNLPEPTPRRPHIYPQVDLLSSLLKISLSQNCTKKHMLHHFASPNASQNIRFKIQTRGFLTFFIL